MKKIILISTVLVLAFSFLAIPTLSLADDNPGAGGDGGDGGGGSGVGNTGGDGGSGVGNTGGGGGSGPSADQLGDRSTVKLENPLGDKSIKTIIDSIVKFITRIGSIVVTIMIIIGAFQMIFSAGDPEKFKKGKTTIVYAVIGLLIILIANGIMAVVRNVLET
jgi:hypothetical protein